VQESPSARSDYILSVQATYHKKTNALVPGVFQIDDGNIAFVSFLPLASQTKNPTNPKIETGKDAANLGSFQPYSGPEVKARTSRIIAPTESKSPTGSIRQRISLTDRPLTVRLRGTTSRAAPVATKEMMESVRKSQRQETVSNSPPVEGSSHAS
jgi:hypothetical protein